MRACCGIIPPYLLERLGAAADETIARQARATLAQDYQHRAGRPRAVMPTGPAATPAAGGPAAPQRTISDAAHSTT
ncbi:MAG: peptidase M4 family protein, partial [Actinomycetota bacterium]|nr:peptidase M4 family protein [Actinomycetota bacterium]